MGAAVEEGSDKNELPTRRVDPLPGSEDFAARRPFSVPRSWNSPVVWEGGWQLGRPKSRMRRGRLAGPPTEWPVAGGQWVVKKEKTLPDGAG